MKHKIGFIGLGLIGGSIAKAIRQYYPDYEIVAFDKNKESLALATQESMIDVAATTLTIIFKIVTIYSYAHRSHIIPPI